MALATVLPELTALAVEDGAAKSMACFTSVELDQVAPAIGFIVHIGQQVQRPGDTPSSAIARTRVEDEQRITQRAEDDDRVEAGELIAGESCRS